MKKNDDGILTTCSLVRGFAGSDPGKVEQFFLNVKLKLVSITVG